MLEMKISFNILKTVKSYIIRKSKFNYLALRLFLYDLSYFKTFVFKRNYDEEVYFSKLRTKAHILDKGLNIIPFEKGHGKNVYLNCLELMGKIKSDSIINDPAYHWCKEVLFHYENAQKLNNNISHSKQVTINEEERKIFNKVVRSRISCRNFTNERIENDIWDRILEMAVLAPSSCCRQPARYYIINNPEIILKLIPNIAGATGFSKGIPNLICVTADHRAYDIKDRFLPFIDVALNVENFVLACSSFNVSTTILNIQHATKKKKKKLRIY